jgi:hypothetical protein
VQIRAFTAEELEPIRRRLRQQRQLRGHLVYYEDRWQERMLATLDALTARAEAAERERDDALATLALVAEESTAR